MRPGRVFFGYPHGARGLQGGAAIQTRNCRFEQPNIALEPTRASHFLKAPRNERAAAQRGRYTS